MPLITKETAKHPTTAGTAPFAALYRSVYKCVADSSGIHLSSAAWLIHSNWCKQRPLNHCLTLRTCAIRQLNAANCLRACVWLCACVCQREGIPSLLHLVRFVGDLQGCCEVFGLKEHQLVAVTHTRSHQATVF